MSYEKRKRLMEWQRQIELSHIFVIGGNTIFVSTFSPHSHFGPYLFFFIAFNPQNQKPFHFDPYRYFTNGK